MDEFADIRPYRDSEVREVLDRLLVDDELLNAVAALRMPKASRWFPKLLRPLISAILRRQFKRVVSVADFQQRVKSYMDSMIARSTSAFTVSGLET